MTGDVVMVHTSLLLRFTAGKYGPEVMPIVERSVPPTPVAGSFVPLPFQLNVVVDRIQNKPPATSTARSTWSPDEKLTPVVRLPGSTTPLQYMVPSP
jgi:hypothetical protein